MLSLWITLDVSGPAETAQSAGAVRAWASEGVIGVSELERRTPWVRAGGRCTLCKVYLLEGGLSGEEVPLGERAHIVGREDSSQR